MRCPICRATGNSTAQCRRCKGDLSLLVQLEGDRAAHIAAAKWSAGHGEAETCLFHAERAQAIRRDAESLRLMAVAMLLKSNFAVAVRIYRQISIQASVEA